MAGAIIKNQINPTGIPDIYNVIPLWSSKVTEENNFGNPFESIVIASLYNIADDEIISKSPLSLSEAYIHRILYANGIKNTDGRYIIENRQEASKSSLNKYHVKNKLDNNDIKTILDKWLNQAKSEFSDIHHSWLDDHSLTSILYRYIQWGETIGIDNKTSLSNYILNALKSNNVTVIRKQRLVKALNLEVDKYEAKTFAFKDPIAALFNDNNEIKELLKKYR
jgi:hypothetical protein